MKNTNIRVSTFLVPPRRSLPGATGGGGQLARGALVRCIGLRDDGRGICTRKKIARNPSNHESWWWPTAAVRPATTGPHIEVRRDAAASFVPLPLGYRRSAIMRFLVSLRDRDPKSLARDSAARCSRGESADQSLRPTSERVLAFAFQSRVDRKIVAVLFLSLRNCKEEKREEKQSFIVRRSSNVKNVPSPFPSTKN